MASAAGLNHLLKATSKDAVAKFFNACFRHRHNPSEIAASRHVLELALSPEESAALVASGVAVLTAVLYESADVASADQIAGLLPSPAVDERLRGLVSQILFAGLPMWREAAIEGRAGPPKLVEAEWEVNNAEGSSSISRFSVPSVTLGLTIQDSATSVHSVPVERTVAVEVDHSGLQVLVEDMRRVRDLLNSMTAAGRSSQQAAAGPTA